MIVARTRWSIANSKSIVKYLLDLVCLSDIGSCLNLCTLYFGVKPYPVCHLMGDLPSAHCNPSFPFANVGMKYAGLYLLRALALHKAFQIKTYVCPFVSMTTKAVHLALALDLSSQAFLHVLCWLVSWDSCPQNV